jgi:hypothetical protein
MNAAHRRPWRTFTMLYLFDAFSIAYSMIVIQDIADAQPSEIGERT